MQFKHMFLTLALIACNEISAMQASLATLNAPFKTFTQATVATPAKSWFRKPENFPLIIDVVSIGAFLATVGGLWLAHSWHMSNWRNAREELYRQYGGIGLISYLNQSNQIDIDKIDPTEGTILHYAARNGNINLLNEALRLGAQRHVQAKHNGYTPIHEAVTAAALDPVLGKQVLDILHQHGAKGEVAEHPYLKHYDIQLARHPNPPSPSLAIIQKLLEMGANPNARTETWLEQFLYRLPQTDAVALLQLLKDHGLNIEACVSRSFPESLLAYFVTDTLIENVDKRKAIIHKLVELGADPRQNARCQNYEIGDFEQKRLSDWVRYAHDKFAQQSDVAYFDEEVQVINDTFQLFAQQGIYQ